MAETATKDFAYRFLRDIAQDLSRKELKFPTFIDASLGVRMALGKKDLSNIELARVVSSEPLLCARVVALANSAALNPSGREVGDVKNAVLMVGQNAVRSLSVTLAMEQISHAKELEPFKVQARELWEHCLEVAALAFVIAKRRGLANPDEALFAGLVHDLVAHSVAHSEPADPQEGQGSADDEHDVAGQPHPLDKAVAGIGDELQLASREVPVTD